VADNKEDLNDQMQVRRDKVDELKENGYNPYASADLFKRDTLAQDIRDSYGEDSKEELEEKKVHVKIGGRLVSKRGKGKAGFGDLQDMSGKIQIYVRRDDIGQDDYNKIWKKADLWGYPRG